MKIPGDFALVINYFVTNLVIVLLYKPMIYKYNKNFKYLKIKIKIQRGQVTCQSERGQYEHV